MPDAATILLVDDEDAVQKLLTFPLEREGFREDHPAAPDPHENENRKLDWGSRLLRHTDDVQLE